MNIVRVLMLSLLTLLVLLMQGTKGNINSGAEQCAELDPSIIGWAGYKAEWMNQDLRMAERMYPFGPKFCDVAHHSEAPVTIADSILFYAVKYDSIILTFHGYVSFSSVDLPTPDGSGEWRPPYPWPNKLFGSTDGGKTHQDPAMAAIFYAPQKTKLNGVLNYRVLRRSGNGDRVSLIKDGMLEQLSEDVRAAVVGAAKFTATYGLVVTWQNTTFEGALCTADPINDQCPRNTYQMVIVTDSVDTFVIYNYHNITWAGSTEMGCFPTTGRPADSLPNCVGAQIGFNVGDGRYFWSHPYSLSTSVILLDEEDMKGSTVIGRFFYKVSDAFILRGGCTNDVSIAGPKWPLAISPNAGAMLGGYDMNISAPCFTSAGAKIQCKFGEGRDWQIITEGFADSNPMMARCPVPKMAAIGRVLVGVSNDGGSNFRYTTHVTVGINGYVPAGVTLNNAQNDWLNVENFEIRWDPYGISWRTVEYVDIKLFGYKESALTGDTSWKELHTLATRVKNDGYYTVYSSQHQCGGLDAAVNCVEYTVGLLGVEVHGTANGVSPTVVWSDPLPLGWFVKTEAPNHLGTNWAHEMCRLWHSEDIKLENWDKDLPVCPCTLTQAYHDWGRFAEDIDCTNRKHTQNVVNNCKRHQGAIHCVRSTFATSTGAGAHCCYDSTGDLMYSEDTVFGSIPDKAHAWGVKPYGTSYKVPLLSHWYWDIAPHYPCCEWQNNNYDCYSLYVKRRTTPSCQSYGIPGRAAAYGDPHVKTFDGVSYTFNGKGEYILLHVENAVVAGKDISFTLQGRYQQPKAQAWGVPKGTVITAVAMQTVVAGVNGDKLEIQRNNYKPGDRRLLVYVNEELIDFRDPRMWRQDFNDLVMFNNDLSNAKFHMNFTAIFRESQIGVQVAYQSGHISIITILPPEMETKTTGLFGIWDGVPDNDILRRGGGSPIPPDQTQKIHEIIGPSWQISGAESLLSYWAKVNRDYYSDPNYVPAFIPEFPGNNSKVTIDQVNSVCGSNLHCKFDYMITLDAMVARDTLALQNWMQEQSTNSKEVVTCGYLGIPFAVTSGSNGYYPGIRVTVTGCRDGFKLEGPTTYECVQTIDNKAAWKPLIATKCVDQTNAKEAETQMALAIGVPVGIVVLIIIIGVIGLLCYLRQKRIDRQGPRTIAGELEPVPPSAFYASDIRAEDYPQAQNKKKPRPARPGDLSRSHDDLSNSYGPRGNNNIVNGKLISASADALDRDISLSAKGSSIRDEPDLDMSLQSETSYTQRPSRPYNYPRNTEALAAERRRAPYMYPRNTESNLSPEERALIEQRTKEYNYPEPR